MDSYRRVHVPLWCWRGVHRPCPRSLRTRVEGIPKSCCLLMLSVWSGRSRGPRGQRSRRDMRNLICKSGGFGIKLVFFPEEKFAVPLSTIWTSCDFKHLVNLLFICQVILHLCPLVESILDVSQLAGASQPQYHLPSINFPISNFEP